MKKVLLFVVAMLMFTSQVFAERVTQDDAALVATHFMNPQVSQSGGKKAPQKRVVMKMAAQAQQNEYYVFENADGKGWVMIAANDAAHPILAYSLEGKFRTDNQPSNLKHWLGKYDEQIRIIESEDMAASEEVAAEWEALRKGTAAMASVVVEPLIQTKWDQGSPYWNLCPKNCYTGCVATAMAQVMNYWQWPKQGTGSSSVTYNNKSYSADFSATTYDWDNMLDAYGEYYDEDGNSHTTSSGTTAQKNAIATLMYHCGVAVGMEYSTDGSGALTINWNDESEACAENALWKYFGYKKSSIKGYYRDGYGSYYSSWTQTKWIQMLKDELDAARPIMYAGGDSNNESGHSFVCDGYDSSNYFHFNWGWSGYCDAYYTVNSLIPSIGSDQGTGAGGGNGDYSYGQDVIIGIVPDKPENPVSSITLDPASLTLKINEKGTIAATVLPTDATQTVTWSSSNEAVATVSNGVVKGIAAGTATISAAATDGSGVKATCAVTVTDEVLEVSDYSDVHESNVTLTTEGSTKATAAVVNIDDTEYDALKFGTGNVKGIWNLTVPAGTNKLYFHAAAWNGGNITIDITSASASSALGNGKRKAVAAVGVDPSSISVSASTGVSGNSPFTITEDVTGEGYYFELDLSGVDDETTLTFTPSGNRFVVWGVNAVATTTNGDPDAPSITVSEEDITLEATLSNGVAKVDKTITVTGTNLNEDADQITVMIHNLGSGSDDVFSIEPANLPAAGGEVTIHFNVNAAVETVEDSYYASITFNSSDANSNSISKEIYVTVNVSEGSNENPDAPSITVSEEPVIFDVTLSNGVAQAEKTITVTGVNLAGEAIDVILSHANSDGVLSINTNELSLDGGEITISLYATVADSYDGTLAFTCENFSKTITVTANVSEESSTPTGGKDVLKNENTINATSSTYSSWTATGASGAEYAGQSAGSNGTIQLRSSNSNSGIVSTKSAGKVSKVAVTWNSSTSDDRILNIYGSNTAYSAPTDLYSDATMGTKIGTIKKGESESTELTIDDDYAYVGLRSASGAVYLDQVEITWTAETQEPSDCHLSNIVVDAADAKTEFVVGEQFTTSGLVVTAYYYSTSATECPEKVVDGWVVSNQPDMSQEDIVSVEISYSEGETTCTQSYEIIITEPKYYTIKWMGPNATLLLQEQVQEGAALVLPADPTCESGRVFVGWTEQSSFSEAPADLFTEAGNKTVTGEATYYAAFATATQSQGGGESTQTTLTIADYEAPDGTFGNFVFTAGGSGTSAAYNGTGKDARYYAGNTLTIESAEAMTKIVFTISTQGKKRLAPITVDNGEIAEQASGDEYVTWTGNSTTVTFTVGAKANYGSEGETKAGQLDFTSVDITTGGGGTSVTYSDYSQSCSSNESSDKQMTLTLVYKSGEWGDDINVKAWYTNPDDNSNVQLLGENGAAMTLGQDGFHTITVNVPAAVNAINAKLSDGTYTSEVIENIAVSANGNANIKVGDRDNYMGEEFYAYQVYFNKFYDEDGTTLLWTAISDIEDFPIYEGVTPYKDANHIFNGWTPALAKADGEHTPTFVQAQIADELLPGKFTVDKNGQRVKFARGNIVHRVSDGSWEIARTQDFVVGHNNIHIGDPDYTGLIDHFAWSTDDRNDYGVYPSNADADYEGDYVEWGALFGSEWVTMTKDQWYYLINTRENHGQLWGNGQVADRKGVIFLPDDWQLPDGMSFVAQYKTDNYFSHDAFEHNVYTAEEWQIMENAGAIFLPAAGMRVGGYGNTMNGSSAATFTNPETGYYSWYENLDDYGYYWTSQLDGEGNPYFLVFGGERNNYTYENPVFWGGRPRRYGESVRLAQLVPEYTITVADGIENGTVAANVSKAEEGEIITLTITPADGYKLKEVTVIDENSEPVVVSANNTFAMPASNVTVSAVFEEKPQVTGYVRVESAPNDWSGKYLIVYEDGSLALNGGLTDKLDAVGNSITVSISEGVIAASEEVDAASFTIAAIDGGYSILGAGGLYMGQTSDANGMQSNNETVYLNTISLSESGDALISSGGAYLRYNSASNQTRFRYYKSATYTSQQPVHLYKSSDEVTPVEKYAINIKQIDNATISVVGNLTEAAEGQTVTLSIATASGWDLDYFTTNGDPVVGNSFTMPAEAVEVSAVLKQHVAELFYITLDYDNTKGIVQLPNEAPNGLEAGTEVTIDLTYQPGYTLGSLTVINELTSESVEIQDAVAATQKIFIMPASNVTITIEFVERVYYTVTVADGIENGTVVADPTSAEEGDEVTLTITPADGYQLKSLTVVDANDDPVEVANNSFTMPASNVTISAEFEEATGGTATFIFNTDDGLAALGIEKPETGNGTALGDAVYTSNGINMSATSGGTPTRVWNSNGNTELRIYSGATLTLGGATITRIAFTGNAIAVFSVEVGAYNSGVWEGEANEVVFTATGSGKINTITVTYSGSVTPAVKYYLAADASLVGDANAWQPNVVEMVNGTITISDVAAGEHKFKVTDGQWNSETETDHEFTTTDADCTTADVSYDSDGNICFTTYKVQDVVISIVNGKVCVKADTEKLYYLAADASLVGDANAWQPNVVEMVNGTITLNNIAAGTHAFKVTDGAWNGGAETDHEFNVWNDECSNVTLTHDDYGNISFSTNEEQNITISIVNKEICVEVADIPVTLNAHYAKVSEALSDWSGDYLIVYEEGALAFNGGLDDITIAQNGLSVEIKETEKGIKYIQANDATVAAEFSIAIYNNGYTIQNKSALYIGQTTDANGIKAQAAELENSISYNSTDEWIDIIASGGAYLRYNATSGQERFRYFKSSTYSAQKPVQLYKKADGETPTEVENNAHTEVMISITGNTLVNMTGHEVGIFSVTGQRMATVVEHFDISTLPAGMYVVSDGKNTFKLLTR